MISASQDNSPVILLRSEEAPNKESLKDAYLSPSLVKMCDVGVMCEVMHVCDIPRLPSEVILRPIQRVAIDELIKSSEAPYLEAIYQVIEDECFKSDYLDMNMVELFHHKLNEVRILFELIQFLENSMPIMLNERRFPDVIGYNHFTDCLFLEVIAMQSEQIRAISINQKDIYLHKLMFYKIISLACITQNMRQLIL